MQESKLIDTIRCLSRKELRRFEDYVKSPFFNKNEDLVNFYVYLKSLAPRFPEDLLHRKSVYEHSFPGTEYNEKHLGYLMSDLLLLAEAFIAYERYSRERILPLYHILSAYNEWDLDKNYNAVMREATDRQEKYPYRDTTYYFNQYLLATVSNLNFDKQKKRKFDLNLQEAADNLDLFYLAVKLKYCCEIINRTNVLSGSYELRLLNEIINYLNQRPDEQIPAIAIYHRIALMLTESDKEEHFHKLKSLLAQHSDKFPLHEIRDIYAYAQNYCAKKINTGNTRYLREAFSLFQALLEKKILFTDKYLSHQTYKNIVTVALRLQEYGWAEKFIYEYRDSLTPEFRETAFAYNYANLCFHKRDYSEALKSLLRVDFPDVYYHLNTKLLMLKIYYEINEEEALYSLIDAFKIYLKRNKLVSEYQRKTYFNLLRFVQKLMRLIPGKSQKLDELEKQIRDTQDTTNMKWLMDKLQEKRGGRAQTG